MTDSAAVAKTILRQLGGNRFMMMTGAKNLVHGDDQCGYVSMKIGRNAKKINYVKVTLTPMDLYNVEFGYRRGLNYTVRNTVEGIDAQMMRGAFEHYTGMATHL